MVMFVVLVRIEYPEEAVRITGMVSVSILDASRCGEEHYLGIRSVVVERPVGRRHAVPGTPPSALPLPIP